MHLDIRRAVQFAIAIVMLLGLFVAASNLPVLTHCQYYGECSLTQADASANSATVPYSIDD